MARPDSARDPKITRPVSLGRSLLAGCLVLGGSILVACQTTTLPASPSPDLGASARAFAPAPVTGTMPVASTTAAPTPASATARPSPTPSLIHGSGTVNVMYAGSLVALLEKHVGPAFNTATGFTFQGEGKGSVAIANLIKGKTRTPDIFISADPSVNALLQGPANGNYVSWWAPFARTALVVAWSSRSRFAQAFEDAKAGKGTWESVLEQPGLRLGRTDPALDPKGYRTLWLFQLDEARTGDQEEARRILGSPDNPAQIFPEEQLVARLQGGQLDAGIFYQIEAVEAHLPFLELPADVNQGDPAQAAHYASVSYTNKKGTTFKGTPILYTVTIPRTARHQLGAESFVQYLFSEAGQRLLAQEGLLSAPPIVSGDPGAVPASLQAVVEAP